MDSLEKTSVKYYGRSLLESQEPTVVPEVSVQSIRVDKSVGKSEVQ